MFLRPPRFCIIGSMNDDEFVAEIFRRIKEMLGEERAECASNSRLDEKIRGEIAGCYDEDLNALSSLMPKISGVDSLFNLDDEDFALALSLMENYAERFVVDGTDSRALSETEEEYSRLADLLFDMYGEFEEDDGDDEESGEDD